MKVIRNRDDGPDDEGSHEAEPAEPKPAGEAFLSRYLPERRDSLPGRRKQSQTRGQEGETSSLDFGAFGQQLAAVLAAAEQAASDIRHKARREADQIRAEATEEAARIESSAAAVLRDAEQQRSEVEKYAADTRATAIAYADEKRREGEQDAERIKARGEEEGRAVVQAAERRAQEIEQAAERRRNELAAESSKLEDRLKDFLMASNALSRIARDALGAKAGADVAANDESLDEVLRRLSASPVPPEERPAERSEA